MCQSQPAFVKQALAGLQGTAAASCLTPVVPVNVGHAGALGFV
jgi:hypothetical protein